MAIISIPTSIGGVTIPGGLISGPLGALFGNKYGLDTLQYPRDLQSATKGHVVHFTIFDVKPILYEEASNFKVPTMDQAKQKFLDAGNAITNFDTSAAKDTIYGTAYEIGDKLTNIPGSSIGIESKGLTFQPRRTKSKSNIFLYMPETVNFQYNPQYDDSTNVLNMLSGGSKAWSKLKPKVKGSKDVDHGGVYSTVIAGVESLGQSGALKAFGQKAGYAVNPQLQMLFQGIGFREFQMAFTFTPYSRDEAKQVEEIIKLFRKSAAPSIVTGAAGMLFIPPSAFKIQFMSNGVINNKINQVAESVITSIDVNYAPNGWSAHDDGAPVQTTLTLQFKEIYLIDRDMIEQGF